MCLDLHRGCWVLNIFIEGIEEQKCFNGRCILIFFFSFFWSISGHDAENNKFWKWSESSDLIKFSNPIGWLRILVYWWSHFLDDSNSRMVARVQSNISFRVAHRFQRNTSNKNYTFHLRWFPCAWDKLRMELVSNSNLWWRTDESENAVYPMYVGRLRLLNIVHRAANISPLTIGSVLLIG